MKKFEIKNLSLKGAKIINRKKNSDQRGYFSRLFCFDELNEEDKFDTLKQINISYTKTKNTIRGLHFQLPPFAETKIVTCTKGKIFDVIVDLRKDSSTFLNFHNEILSESEERSLLVPEGFAHGFLSLDDNCEVLYFHTKNYNPDYERGIRYNDPKLNINWPSKPDEISDRDLSFPLLTEQFDGLD